MTRGRNRTFVGLTVAAVIAAALPGVASAAARVATVTSVTPSTGRTSGGSRVVVRGTSFQHVSAVRFGSVSVTGKNLTMVSSTRLVALAPAHVAGSVDIRVVTPAGQSSIRAADRFRYVAPPSITAVSPTAGLPDGGTRVTVKGANFVGTVKVGFGGSAGSAVAVASSGTVQVTAPAHSPGAVDIRVSTPYGTSSVVASDHFTYRTAPDAVTGLAVQDLTATSATLRWSVPPSSDASGVMIRRADGATPPAGPTTGTLVARLPIGQTAFVDTGLARNSTYSYSLFAYTAAGPLFSGAASTSLTTPANSRPDMPTDLSLSPPLSTGSLCPPAGDAWLGSLAGGNLTLAARISDPDGDAQQVWAHFRLWDQGGTGTDSPTDVVGPADPAGESAHELGSGGFVSRQLDGSLLVDGHLYGADAVADDGSAQSATSAACHFWYDASPPTSMQVTSPNQTFHVGSSAEFDLSAADVVPSTGRYSGIDHFAYSFGSASDLDSDGGTHLAPQVTGTDGTASASFTFTPGTWGTTYLVVHAVDKAGNVTPVTTYPFYVTG